MNLIEVVILAGVQCLSPVQAVEGTTIAGKVPCAVLIRMNQETGDVDFTPPAAASDPQVIAMLVRPGPADGSEPGQDPFGEGDAQEPQAAPKPQAREKPAPEKPSKTARAAEKRKTAAVAKKQRVRKRKDSCGSMKAVWYTNTEGRRKYRCVRRG